MALNMVYYKNMEGGFNFVMLTAMF